MLKSLADAVVERWSGLGAVARTAIVVIVALGLFAGSRAGVLGPQAGALSQIAYPGRIPILDRVAPSAELRAKLTLVGLDEPRVIGAGDNCPSGARLRIEAAATRDGWLSMLGMSAMGAYPLREDGYGPLHVVAGTVYEGEVVLDDELGIELFALLHTYAPHEAAQLGSWIRGHADTISDIRSGKGGAVVSAFRDLPPGAAGKTLYCVHT